LAAAQNLAGASRVGNQDVRVARPPRAARERHRPRGNAPDRIEQIEH